MQAPLEAAGYRLFSVLVAYRIVEYSNLCNANPTTKKANIGLAVHHLKGWLVNDELLSEEDYLILLTDTERRSGAGKSSSLKKWRAWTSRSL